MLKLKCSHFLFIHEVPNNINVNVLIGLFILGYNDEYMLEDLEITLADQIQRYNKVDWGAAWEDPNAGFIEREDTYSLNSTATLDEAIKDIVQFLGLQPCERSDKTSEGKTVHTLLLSGKTKIAPKLLNCYFTKQKKNCV